MNDESADEYNEEEIAAGRFKSTHISELVARFQRDNGLAADGKAGPKTRALLELLRGRAPGDVQPDVVVRKRETKPLQVIDNLEVLTIDPSGWLVGAGVTRIPMHPSWFYSALKTPSGQPRAVVFHYTATDPGTADNMFKRRQAPLDTDPNDGDGVDRQASWHVSIETDGTIYQGASFLRGCWHAGGPTAKAIPGVGHANRTAVAIELVGHGASFPEAQVKAAARVLKALTGRYSIPRELAMVTHQELDPTRKADPGPVWMGSCAPRILHYIFGG